MPFPEVIERGLELPDGARYLRCALQVNPWAYIERERKATPYDEVAYHSAIIDACVASGIGAIAVTDHHAVLTSASLLQLARDRGLVAYPGFEATAKDGVHLLCIFDPAKDLHEIDRCLGALGLPPGTGPAELASLDTVEILGLAREWDAVVVAAHVTKSAGGLLKMLHGRARAAAWTAEALLAAAIPGRTEDLEDSERAIVANRDVTYRREHPLAVLNASDVSSPDHVPLGRSWSWLKMSAPTIEGLRQAFLDPGSRVRRSHETTPEAHARIEVVAWEGGYLDGAALHLNDDLNVLIGGRGAGKSTVVESIRFAFDLPSSGTLEESHDGFVRNVLRSGTRVSALVASPRPEVRRYVVQRSVGSAPIVLDEDGNTLDLLPVDVMPDMEVYGQRELAELARSAGTRSRLLARFTDDDSSVDRSLQAARTALDREDRRLLEIERELVDLDAALIRLPALREQLQRYEEAGLEDRVRMQGLFTQEQALWERALGRIDDIDRSEEQLGDDLPLDVTFLAERALTGLPSAARLREVRLRLDRLSDALAAWRQRGAALRADARGDLEVQRAAWETERTRAHADYEAALRSAGGAGATFIEVRQEVEALGPVHERRERLRSERAEREQQRKVLLDEWCDLRRDRFRREERAARRITGQLRGQVEVSVTYEADRQRLIDFLREHVGGRLDRVRQQLLEAETCSPRELADTCRNGVGALAARYGISGSQADRMAGLDEPTLRALEILELAPRTDVRLNVGGDEPVWRPLEELSTGQKATALLLILLLHVEAPLVVDQPEDDLDNAFIADGIVPRLRQGKQRRQFVFSTHNPNVPVLGDAELIVALEGHGEPGSGGGTAKRESMGSIDDPAVRRLVATLLEGGEAAFERRRRRYGF